MLDTETRLRFFVIGCGRWGSFIAWYISQLKQPVTLYGRASSANMKQLMRNRKNEYIALPDAVELTCDVQKLYPSDVVVISVGAQQLDRLMQSLEPMQIQGKTIVLCMKGLEIQTGARLSEVVKRHLDPSNHVAVWLGPGHVQDFYQGKPNCMIIDSDEESVKTELVRVLSSKLIRFYYGTDLIGNEIGAALKNVIGIAAGMLDGMGLSSLKGALMARGTNEVARLICHMGGKFESAYGLSHLGDYEATLFSPYSHNRIFGERFVRGQSMEKLAEGYDTVQAVIRLQENLRIEMPICEAVYQILFEGMHPEETLDRLFQRNLKKEFR